jgi:hypothetical protein
LQIHNQQRGVRLACRVELGVDTEMNLERSRKRLATGRHRKLYMFQAINLH